MKYKHEVRCKTFEDVVADKPLLELPIVFNGSLQECIDYCKNQDGYVLKNAKNQLIGFWFYNKEKSIALIIT